MCLDLVSLNNVDIIEGSNRPDRDFERTSSLLVGSLIYLTGGSLAGRGSKYCEYFNTQTKTFTRIADHI